MRKGKSGSKTASAYILDRAISDAAKTEIRQQLSIIKQLGQRHKMSETKALSSNSISVTPRQLSNHRREEREDQLSSFPTQNKEIEQTNKKMAAYRTRKTEILLSCLQKKAYAMIWSGHRRYGSTFAYEIMEWMIPSLPRPIGPIAPILHSSPYVRILATLIATNKVIISVIRRNFSVSKNQTFGKKPLERTSSNPLFYKFKALTSRHHFTSFRESPIFYMESISL